MIIKICAVAGGLIGASSLFMLDEGVTPETRYLVFSVSFALMLPAIIRVFRDTYRAAK